MRVEKKFAPITIVIEYEDERNFLLDLISKARQGYNGFWPRSKFDDPFVNKCNFLYERLSK